MTGEGMRVPDSDLDYDAELIYTYCGRPFTGIGYENVPGHVLSEISYVDGFQEGPSRDWYASGRLKGETMFMRNARHGPSREWDEDGVLLSEEIYEHGVLVRSTRFDHEGRVTEQFEISPTDRSYTTLQRLRDRFG